MQGPGSFLVTIKIKHRNRSNAGVLLLCRLCALLCRPLSLVAPTSLSCLPEAGPDPLPQNSHLGVCDTVLAGVTQTYGS